jgi:hypothetical protein
MRRLVSIAIAVAVTVSVTVSVSVSGCARPPDPVCIGRPAASFAVDVAPIFRARCGGAECHGANFYGAHARAHLVDAPALECGSARVLVAPGSPDDSYLYDKLAGRPLCSGVPMPKGDVPLAREELARVFDWICAGAPD